MSEDRPKYDADRHPDRREGPHRGSSRKAFLVRLPPDLHDELRRWADAELRSLNAHIEYLLREAVRRKKGSD